MASLDLLGQLRQTGDAVWIEIDETSTNQDSHQLHFETDQDPESFMEEYEKIKSNIAKIEENAQRIQQLTNLCSVNNDHNSQFEKIMNKMDIIIVENKQILNNVKQSLQNAKKNNDNYSTSKECNEVQLHWRYIQLNSSINSFKEASNKFNSKVDGFNRMLQETQSRQLDIVTEKKLSQEEKNELLANPRHLQSYLQRTYDLQLGDKMLDRLNELENRYEGISRIEQSLRELHEMWEELHSLITEQQELLDNVSYNVAYSFDHVKSGRQELIRAEKHQKTMRKLQLCIGICLIATVVIILSIIFLIIR